MLLTRLQYKGDRDARRDAGLAQSVVRVAVGAERGGVRGGCLRRRAFRWPPRAVRASPGVLGHLALHHPQLAQPQTRRHLGHVRARKERAGLGVPAHPRGQPGVAQLALQGPGPDLLGQFGGHRRVLRVVLRGARPERSRRRRQELGRVLAGTHQICAAGKPKMTALRV